MDLMEPVKIRKMEKDDLDAITEIDHLTLDRDRRKYWEAKLDWHQKHSTIASLVAVRDDEVVGFLFADAAGWEYGIPDTTGTLEVIGVHPDYRDKGVATLLVDEMINKFREVGVHRVYTFVNWRSGDLMGFFDSMGFHHGDLVNLELTL
ncbi:MAG: GNAT family N-acetyltransferase [Planctomycetota bacterium]|jgi:ribosomal protein S18 acetylase RimI-like enzyme